MNGIWNLDWLAQNSQRKYPITDDSNVTDTTGSFVIPNDFVVSLDFPVHAGLDVDPVKFQILNIGVYSSGYVVIIGYGFPAVQVATASIPVTGFTKNTTYALGGIGDFSDSIGKITIGSLQSISQQPGGLFTFGQLNAKIEPDCIRPIIRGVSSLLVRNGNNQSIRLYGDIELVADVNMQITTSVVSGQNPQIQFSALQGEGLTQPCVCAGDETAVPIRRINGIPGTAAGDFTLLGNDCLKITTIPNGLQLNDACSQPCCGCSELEVITTDMQQFGIMATTLQGFLSRLQNSVDTMNSTVLGSQLQDNGCVECL